MNIYVGNLAYQVTEDELRSAFAPYGEVASVTLVKDKFSGESKGFAFVEMPVQAQAEEAIKRLDGQALKGRNIRVNQARPKKESRPRRPDRY
jgi:RNA recognition motif-containing protein